ncbi:hypothetical protein WISP_85116 [Willisornis vidua]|uniref:Uncharacterized protein n=1 Tax=Willisornis vidua TaxID=1566151 RepID=A0ABQ9D3A2_9PASS|nr:hypothetical protein WISP_85116 [Willisornis vidua]
MEWGKTRTESRTETGMGENPDQITDGKWNRRKPGPDHSRKMEWGTTRTGSRLETGMEGPRLETGMGENPDRITDGNWNGENLNRITDRNWNGGKPGVH